MKKNSYILSLCGEMKWSILSVTCLFPESLCYAACCMGEGRRDTWNFVLLNYFFLIVTMWHLLLMLWSELWGRWWECWNSPTLLHHLKTIGFESISQSICLRSPSVIVVLTLHRSSPHSSDVVVLRQWMVAENNVSVKVVTWLWR